MFGNRQNTRVEGTGVVSKSHGHYVLRAAISATEARGMVDLEEMKKRVPVEEEARTRGRAGRNAQVLGDGSTVLYRDDTMIDPITLATADGQLTYSGREFARGRAEFGDPDAQATVRAMNPDEELHDPFHKPPERRDGESDEAFARREAAYQRKHLRRLAQRARIPATRFEEEDPDDPGEDDPDDPGPPPPPAKRVSPAVARARLQRMREDARAELRRDPYVQGVQAFLQDRQAAGMPATPAAGPLTPPAARPKKKP